MSIIARHADQPRQPHRAAAADIDAAAALRQRVIGRALGDADVRRRPRARARRRPRRRAARRPPAPCRTRSARRRDATCASARRLRRCRARSVRRGRGRRRNARRAPCSTTALMPSGSSAKKRSMPSTVVSSSALRFCGRASAQDRDVAARSAASEAGSFGNALFKGFAMTDSCGVGFSGSSGLEGGATTPRAHRSAPCGSRGRRSRWRGCG